MQLTCFTFKGGIFAAFFWIVIHTTVAHAALDSEPSDNRQAENLINKAVILQLHKTTTWAALLNSKHGISYINDPGFLLSLPNFNLENELKLTIDFLYSGVNTNVCRFPARYFWLQQKLSAPELPLNACPDVQEFRSKVPITNIYLIFASESISQPASMLGHAFLKVTGRTLQNQEISHAISFYTDVESYNFPKLLFDSLIIGKQGYFSLSSYLEKVRRYVDEEQRNLWEFQLALTDFQVELVRLSILELKQSHLSYFFQKYNCATVINFLLELSDLSSTNDDLWITPKDLIKNGQKSGLITSSKLIAPSRWLYRKLSEQANSFDTDLMHDQIAKGKISEQIVSDTSNDSYLKFEMARAYNQYAYLENSLDKEIWQKNDLELSEIKAKIFHDKDLISDSNFNPLESPGDSQLSLAYLNDENGIGQSVTFLPISHTIYDDNRSYAIETGLQLFATSLKYQKDTISLERLSIFDMISLTPYNPVTGGYSSRFNIGIDQQKNPQLQNRRVFTTNAALGITKRFYEDIDLFALAGAGFSHTGDSGQLYSSIEIGAVIREIWNLKSTLRVIRTDNQTIPSPSYYTVDFIQSLFFTKQYSALLNIKQHVHTTNIQNEFSLSIKKVF